MFDKDDGYIQLIVEGDIVHDISLETWEFVRSELGNDKLIEFEDIYGSTCWMFSVRFITARSWNKESGKMFKELNTEDKEHGF